MRLWTENDSDAVGPSVGAIGLTRGLESLQDLQALTLDLSGTVYVSMRLVHVNHAVIVAQSWDQVSVWHFRDSAINRAACGGGAS